MCLFHLTGERRWLEAPFVPARDVRLVADPAAGFDEETQRRIRTATVEVLKTGQAPVVEAPDADLLQEMMSICLGENVPDEYVPLMQVDFGFVDDDPTWRNGEAPVSAPAVVIIGAGVSGLCLASKLDALGIEFTIVDKNADVGGTWFENRYPGCGVDTPNHFYSFSFAPNPQWEHYFSPRDEIQNYLEDCAEAFAVRGRLRPSTEVTAAHWNEEENVWELTLDGPRGTEQMRASVVVPATGHFNIPAPVTFEGQTTFTGDILHTARWPAGTDLRSKRVAVIGTGASSMQLCPTIAPTVEHLTIFQRTPQWVRPLAEYNDRVEPDSQWLFEHLPFYGKWYRFTQFWRYGDGLLRFLKKDPEWHDPDRSLNRVNDRHRQEMAKHIESELAERPDLITKCIPGYPPFGKRILLDNDWYKTLLRDNVTLETNGATSFEANGIRTGAGDLHEVDVVIMATGFDVTTLTSRIDVRGIGGLSLAEDWKDENPTAHLGVSVPNFPNMFLMYGPNTNSGHGGSGMWLAETQSRYIAGLIASLAEAGVAAINVKESRRAEHTDMIDQMHEELVWTHPGTGTYYRNKNGQVRSPIPFRLVDYWHMTREPNLDDFHLIA